MGKGYKGVLAALGCAASLAANALATQWTAIDLTPEGPGHASAVNNSGVVVGCRHIGNSVQRAYMYANGTRTDLATPEGSTSCAGVVNENGQVAGSIDGEITLWEGGIARRLGAKGYVRGISDDGVLVGGLDDGANSRAFMWKNGVFTDLGAPPGWTYAIGINHRGQIAVFASGKLFMYENGALHDLGATVTNAYGFNDRGEIVGMASFGHGPEPYIYDGAVRQIAGAYSYAGAVGLNNTGQVLGSGEGVYGFVMDGGNSVRTDGLLGAPWSHSEPDAINDHGWIVGEGGASNDFHAFLLIPKESAAAPTLVGNPMERMANRISALIRAARK
jgi:probable HAF family extracellular repeat protein